MKNRSVAKVILLSLITLGIYTLFWLNATRKELIEHGQKVPPLKILLAPFIVLIGVPILQIIVHFSITDNGSGSPDLASSLNILSLAIGGGVMLVFVPVAVWWFYKYCSAVEVITDGQTSLSFSLCLIIGLTFFGLSFVWPGIIQDGLNRLSAIPTANPRAPGSPLA